MICLLSRIIKINVCCRKPTAYIYFFIYYSYLTISLFNLCMIFFSNLDMYDCEIPSRSATSFCVFSFPSGLSNPNRILTISFSLLLSLVQSTNQKFSLRFIFQIFINRIFFRSQNIRQKQLVSIPVNVQRFVDGHLHLCLAITP